MVAQIELICMCICRIFPSLQDTWNQSSWKIVHGGSRHKVEEPIFRKLKNMLLHSWGWLELELRLSAGQNSDNTLPSKKTGGRQFSRFWFSNYGAAGGIFQAFQCWPASFCCWFVWFNVINDVSGLKQEMHVLWMLSKCFLCPTI